MAVRLIPGAPFNAPSDTRVLSRKKEQAAAAELD